MHDWWPDTWESNSRRQRHPPALDDEELFVVEGFPLAEGAHSCTSAKTNYSVLSCGISTVSALSDQTGHLSLHNDEHGNHPKLRTPQFSALSGSCTCQTQHGHVDNPQRTAPVESPVLCTVCTVRTCLSGIQECPTL